MHRSDRGSVGRRQNRREDESLSGLSGTLGRAGQAPDDPVLRMGLSNQRNIGNSPYEGGNRKIPNAAGQTENQAGIFSHGGVEEARL